MKPLNEIECLNGSAVKLIYTSKSYVSAAQLADREVVALMPCVDIEQGQKTAEIMVRRAGFPLTIVIVFDDARVGFIASVNKAYRLSSSRYAIYVAQDAYPGRYWLILAYLAMEKSQKGLLAFNDGKWFGGLASFGMVRRSWLLTYYDGDLMNPIYKAHGADNELTDIAKSSGMYFYDPKIVLLEVDYKKGLSWGSSQEDLARYKARKKEIKNIF
jgi:hypothetical protein